ncbi:MAG TPA: ABC transporter permease [Candidatus Polarisedimenticolia bacterium]|jgi:putative ABC transport system permease protein|nr:ABC transporter permease [Candidatus Polarisedimenticolia bacterium]
MGSFLQDLRHALRLFLKAPGFTAIAVVTLGLGIGANTALFSVVNAVLMRPLPYEDPRRLVRIHGVNALSGTTAGPVSTLDVEDFRRQNRTLESLAALSNSSAILTGRGEPRPLSVASASSSLLRVLGAKPLLGRFLLPEEEKEGGERVIVVAHEFWRSEFGGDPKVLGQMVTLSGIPRRVVGVLPSGFRSPIPGPMGEPAIWRPLLVPSDLGARGGHTNWCVGRLKPGASVAQAQADLDSLAASIEKTYPETSTGWRTHVVPLQEDLVGEVRRGLVALTGAVALVLAIACANVANLFLVRAAGRTREMAIRRTLGASSWRISRQLLTECLVLAAAGGTFGLLLATWTKDLILAAAGASLPAWADVRLDGTVLGFTLVVSIVTGVLFGLGPALHGFRSDLGRFLQEGTRAGIGLEKTRLRRLLVTGQVALSMVLLAGAGLLLQSLWRLLRVDTGFRTENVLTVTLAPPRARYAETGQINDFYRRLLDRVEAIPGLRAAGLINILPLSGGYSGDSFLVDEHPPVQPGQEPNAEHRTVSEGYFTAMGIPLRRGRLFTPRDDAQAPRVALINEAMARTFFPGEDPMGKHLKYGESREIVGIVGNVRHFAVAEEPKPEYYFPFSQEDLSEYTLVVRGSGDPAPLLAPVRAAVRDLDKDLALSNVRTIADLVDRSVAQPRFRALLLGAFAGLALALAAVGIYGLTAHVVAQRTREIGIRIALGARRSDVLALIVGDGLRPVGVGMAVGLAGTFALTRLLASLLFGVKPADLSTFTAVSFLLGVVTLLACYLPARRATRIDPAVALRDE